VQTLEHVAEILKKHPAARARPLLTSAEEGTGIAELRQMMADLTEGV
jgi:hypothetical protein